MSGWSSTLQTYPFKVVNESAGRPQTLCSSRVRAKRDARLVNDDNGRVVLGNNHPISLLIPRVDSNGTKVGTIRHFWAYNDEIVEPQ